MLYLHLHIYNYYLLVEIEPCLNSSYAVAPFQSKSIIESLMLRIYKTVTSISILK